MPERHFYRFPSVDFFGKSMPGLLFTLLAILLIPEPIFVQYVQNANKPGLAFVVTAIFVIIVVGFSVGQGLNTLSIIFKNATFRIAFTISKILDTQLNQAPKQVRNFTSIDYLTKYKRYSEEPKNTLPQLFSRLRYWIWRQFMDIKRIFVPHRIVFNDWIRRHKVPKRTEDHQPKIDCLEKMFDKYTEDIDAPHLNFPDENEDISKISVSEDIYLLISDYITHQGVNRARRHKSLFIFCQNSAVTMLTFAVLYQFVIWDSRGVISILGPGNSTVLAMLIDEKIIVPPDPLPVVLLIFGCVFLYASSIYQKFYVEYLIVDFINSMSVGESEDTHLVTHNG